MPGPSYAIFDGSVRSKSFNFTFSPGVTPSVCYIQTVPHTDLLANDGTLRIGTEGDLEIVFRDCKLETPQLDVGLGGAYWTLPILDRRWKWQFAYITGSYNISRPDGTYLREKTPQEFATILLSAMGESDFDVGQLPNDTRPEAHWEQGVRADIELEKLSAELGCTVVLNYLTDRVELWRIGSGAELPKGDIDGTAYAPVQLASPQRIRVESGNTLFQDMFVMEAVGLDIDDKWKPIDELSYRPAGGWGKTWPPSGFGTDETGRVRGTYLRHGRTLKKIDLAEATVFRCYRIKELKKGGWVPAHMALSPLQPQSIRDFELFDELADEEISLADGGLRRLPAVIYTDAWRKDKKSVVNPIRYQGGFSLADSKRGIIQFSEPVFRRSKTTADIQEPAVVWFECSFHAGQNGVMHRLALENEYQPAPTTPTRLISRPEILLRVIQRYFSDGSPGTVETNLGAANSKLQFWYDAAVNEYQLQPGGTVSYTRLKPVTLDGLTQQITWSASEREPARTVVSQAQRHNRFVKAPDEYRERLAAKRNDSRLDTIIAHELGGVLV